MPTYDWDAVKGFETIPEGRYPAKFTSFKNFPEPVNGKTGYIQLNYTIDDPESDYNGRTVVAKRYVSVDALPMLKATIAAHGQEMKGRADTDELLNDSLGCDVFVTVVHSEWQGRVTAKVSFVNPRSSWG